MSSDSETSYERNEKGETEGLIGTRARTAIKIMEEQRGNEGRLRGLKTSPGRGYARVPSKPTISASTTSTSLATDFQADGSRTHLNLPRYLFPTKDYTDDSLENYQEEDEIQGDEESQALTQVDEEESFESIRKHFQQLRQVSLQSNKYKMEMEIKGVNKDENLRTAVPHLENLSGSHKTKGECNVDMESTYRPTTQKIQIMNQVLAAVAVSLGSLVVGYCTAYTSPALVTMVHENSTISVTKHEGSWVGGLMPLAALIGGVVGGPLIEFLGRRMTIIGISLPFIVSWLTIALAHNVSIVYAGRAIGGLCVGIGSLCFPVYLGEIIQPEVRGQLGLLPTAFGNIGILVCFVAGKYLDWSGLAYLGAALPVPFLILMLVTPESPHWLASHKGEERARKSLEWLRGKNTDVDSELADIMNTLAESEKEKAGLREMFQRRYIPAVLIALGLMFFQQMSGINAVIFYTVSIFKDAGSTIDENLSTIIVGIVNFASTFVATGLIERLGRKILLYISGGAMIVTLMTLGTFFYFKSYMDVSAYGWVPLVSFVLYVIGFSLGFGPIPWLMMGEILPSKIRGAAASLCTGFNWTCTFFVTKTFQDIIETIGTYGTFWMFGVICMFGLAFVIVFVPETKGKSLEEIEKKLAGSSDSDSESSDYEKSHEKRPMGC